MSRDYIQDYIKYFSVQTGGAPRQEKLGWAIRETLSEEDLKLFFLLPFTGSISPEKLKRKALRAGFTPETFDDCLKRLHDEGFLISYQGKKGRVYERAFVSFTVEQQVRRRKGTPIGAAYGEFWDGLAELSTQMPSKTPYFRVTPVEASLTGRQEKENIKLEIEIPDPREVLPLDIITEMVRQQPLIGVSECYCRLARENRGDGSCHHIRETCFTFNELAETLIETGLARQIDAEEAAEILHRAEEDGLIHNVDNCQGHLKALCNCCSCCCPAVKSYQMGVRNVNAPSRYLALLDEAGCTNCGICVETCPVGAIEAGEGVPVFIAEACIGCGHCVTACPVNTIHMELREKQLRIPKTNDQLWSSIRREAVVSLVREKILGSK
jgi:NAD-dependent dihydropyrimidine dehydrogenase PreA subunit